ncbi:hypothetical protein NPIL_508161 [Nephila pilipes]|uniref:Uncharacterized protein n=1 Tax=Nephila pilipes TaxID=299642 RepID=A0A8X6TZQ4_NEPPI|nr:hypothetical protein NPIL_508161 [Nephila pilipes]
MKANGKLDPSGTILKEKDKPCASAAQLSRTTPLPSSSELLPKLSQPPSDPEWQTAHKPHPLATYKTHLDTLIMQRPSKSRDV